MGKGIKICSVCGLSTGPRAFHCPNGHGFIIKGKKQPDLVSASNNDAKASNEITISDSRKQLKHKEVDWKLLVKNDVIKVVSGGPLWPRKTEDGGDVPFGYYGIYSVKSIDEQGILAYPLKAKTEAGACYIYMGEEKKMKSGSLMRPHKIMKVHRKVKDVN
jgi:hypothetical protein